MNEVPQPTRLATTCVRDFNSVELPERKWLVPGVFPLNEVSILSGAGGIGKSALLYQLLIQSALGLSWCGFEIEKCTSLFVTSEDGMDEMHIRAHEITSACGGWLGDDALWDVRVRTMLGADATLAKPDPRSKEIQLTPFYCRLWETVHFEGINLLILDNVADLFGGSELDRVQVKAFIKLLVKICHDFDCTVILIAHPSVSGMADGTGRSGSTGWANAVRSFWYLRRPDDKNADRNARVLENIKANRGPDGQKYDLVYEKGLFRTPGPTDFVDILAHRKHVRELFIRLYIEERKVGREVTSARSRSGASTVFAKRHDSEGIKADEFEIAMNELVNAGDLKLVEKGPPSKPRSVLVWPGEANREAAK